jgi:hypothetical protein
MMTAMHKTTDGKKGEIPEECSAETVNNVMSDALSNWRTKRYVFALITASIPTTKNPLGHCCHSGFFLFGAPGAIRTPDRLVRSQVLYPTELRARWGRYNTDFCLPVNFFNFR